MAAVDGIIDKIDPGAPLDVDSTVWRIEPAKSWLTRRMIPYWSSSHISR
ncbi:hypothetical protein LCGC14_2695670, partial [marine sediment metagenome]